MTEPKEEDECDSCGFQGPTEAYPRRNHKLGGGGDKRLCVLCAGTHAGNALEYPDQYPNAEAMRTICYVGNVILKAIKDKKDV